MNLPKSRNLSASLSESQPLSQQPLGQHQSVGNVDISGEDNAYTQVSAAGNAEIDQSRYVIYNYYYQNESGLVSIGAESVPDDELVCPYRGLFHFGPEDAAFFFGREVKQSPIRTDQFIIWYGLGSYGN